MKENKINNIPPQVIKRNEFGLLENVDYVFDDKNLVDWRAMVNPEYLIPNAANFTKRGEETPTSIEGVKDSDLIISLGGLKDLAFKRGYKSVEFRPISASVGYSCVVCRIVFLGNFETEGRDVAFESIADASFDNTTGFAQTYLSSIAENRAFCRCIRNFLRLNLLSDEETLKNSTQPTSETTKAPATKEHFDLLQTIMTKKNLTFDHIKEKLIKDKVKGAEDFKELKDIPKENLFDLIGRIKQYKPD